jgi:phage shock protein E
MEKLKEILKNKNVQVVDVRSDWEYAEQHITNAINIPLDEIPARINDFKKLNGPVILYCRSGARSGMATGILKQAGITDVYNGGGIFDMQKLILN